MQLVSGRATIPVALALARRWGGERGARFYARYAAIIETVVFGVMPALSGSPAIMSASLLLFVALHAAPSDESAVPGARAVALVTVFHGAAFLLQTALPATPFAIALVAATWAAVGAVHERENARAADVGRRLAALATDARKSDAEKRAAIVRLAVEILPHDDGLRRARLDGRVSPAWARLGINLDLWLNEETAAGRVTAADTARVRASFEELLYGALTGDTGGSVAPVDRLAETSGETGTAWVIQLVAGRGRVTRAEQAAVQRHLDALAGAAVPVRALVVVEDAAAAEQLEASLRRAPNVTVEFAVRTPGFTLTQAGRRLVGDPALYATASFRVLVPPDYPAWPEINDLDARSRARYRLLVELISGTVPLLAEMTSRFNDLRAFLAVVARQA
jgi:hypothetical protein